MAANEYFNSHPSQDQGYQNRFYDQHVPPGPAESPEPPTSYNAPATSNSPYNDNGYTDPYRQSQQSLTSDTGYYGGSGGGLHDSNSYADNIPLKTHAPGNDEWTQHHPNQPPSPESQRPPATRGFGKRPNKKVRFFSRKTPWFVYTITLVQVVVFIVEIVRNSQLTGSPIEIHPQFNPMIGPSPYVLINLGARYVPCMRNEPCVQDVVTPPTFPCPKTTTNDQTDESWKCTLSDLCGFSGVPNPKGGPSAPQDGLDQSPAPNQWYRFIIPMFLHAGIIHIAFNLILQLTMGREMEQIIGTIRFAIVYFSSGIFGFVLGGNFAPPSVASTGASGCLFGVLALVLLDLLYTWREQRSPRRDLFFICLDIIISFVLGLLPGLDNFSHIGGFLTGLVLGICILHSPNALRERIGQDKPPYAPMSGRKTAAFGGMAMKGFAKQPVGFFKGRKPLWWAWWLIRAGALVGVTVAFILLVNNFYQNTNTCSWCKYLSCLDIKNWCDLGTLKCDKK